LFIPAEYTFVKHQSALKPVDDSPGDIYPTHILIQIDMAIPVPIALEPGVLALLETRQRGQTDLLHLAAALAFDAGAAVIDGGNHFNAYLVIGRVRQETADLSVLDSLQVARAFNCYQVVELIRAVPLNGCPCLVIDMLDTFVDASVGLKHRLMLLSQVLEQLERIKSQQGVVISLSPPREELQQWHQMAAMVREAASISLEEDFMGKTIPTINQVVQQAEIILARFSRVAQPKEREALEELFVSARKHIAAISEANHLLPFEVVQQAMLLEQQKEIRRLTARLDRLERKLDG